VSQSRPALQWCEPVQPPLSDAPLAQRRPQPRSKVPLTHSPFAPGRLSEGRRRSGAVRHLAWHLVPPPQAARQGAVPRRSPRASADRRCSAWRRGPADWKKNRRKMWSLKSKRHAALRSQAAAGSASAQRACRWRARTATEMLAQVARCRRAVDLILSPPCVHFYKLHHRLWKEARPTRSNVRRFCPVCPVLGRWQINSVNRKPVRSKYGGTVLGCLKRIPS
jgi:hypothetical protein